LWPSFPARNGNRQATSSLRWYGYPTFSCVPFSTIYRPPDRHRGVLLPLFFWPIFFLQLTDDQGMGLGFVALDQRHSFSRPPLLLWATTRPRLRTFLCSLPSGIRIQTVLPANFVLAFPLQGSVPPLWPSGPDLPFFSRSISPCPLLKHRRCLFISPPPLLHEALPFSDSGSELCLLFPLLS